MHGAPNKDVTERRGLKNQRDETKEMSLKQSRLNCLRLSHWRRCAGSVFHRREPAACRSNVVASLWLMASVMPDLRLPSQL